MAGLPDPHHVDHGFENELVAGHGSHSLEREQRVSQVVKHPEEQHEVERPDTFGRQIHHVDIYILDS